MEETGSIDWLHITCFIFSGLVVIGLIVQLFVDGLKTRKLIRKTYPDASLSPLLQNISFQYKKFKAILSWSGYSTSFCVILPNEIKNALADAGFRMDISALCGDDGAPKIISQNCLIKSRNAVMKSIRYHAGFLQALNNLSRKTSEFNLTVTLENSEFVITLPRHPPLSYMKEFAESGAALFDQVIAAGAAVHPEILSMPLIAGNFTVNPGEFLNEYSDEAVYDALDDSAPVNHNPAGQTDGWGNHDIYDANDHSPVADGGYALPDANGGGYRPPDES